MNLPGMPWITRRLLLPTFTLLAAACSAAPQVEPADLVLRNGHVVTMDSAAPDAEAIAIRGHNIVAVGTNDDIAPYIGRSTDVIELDGRLAVPGFIEGHGHFMGLGEARMNLDLTEVRNWDEVIRMVAAATRDAATDSWIIGRGWHQEKWDRVPVPSVDGVPVHASLDSVSPDNPVYLTHASGHAAFVNRRALELAGIDRNTPDPAGGEIVRDPAGDPTGLLRETAQRLAGRARARAEQDRAMEDRGAEARRAAQLAAQEALRNGVTTFHDAGSDFRTIDFFRQLEAEGALPLRLYVMVRAPNEQLEEHLPDYLMPAGENDFLVVRSIKVSIDGALGAHGAWLLEPYADMPSSHGLALTTPASLERTAELAIANGFQLNVHAIGDRANREVLDIFERTFRSHPDQHDLRWRIEHAQHLHPQDIGRFAALGVIPAMQGIHATSDGPWVPRRLGEKRAREGAYVWRSLLDNGAIIANGTDVPVEDISPIASFHASVTRRMADGEVFYGEQRMTREEALRSYTLSNAFAAFEEDVKGSITPGKLADIAVLSKNIMRVPESEIPDALVDYTIVGGRVLYSRGPDPAGASERPR
jgi:predicted amidohydrolase YtcJ